MGCLLWGRRDLNMTEVTYQQQHAPKSKLSGCRMPALEHEISSEISDQTENLNIVACMH